MNMHNCAICGAEFKFRHNVNEFTCSNACKYERQKVKKTELKCLRPECENIVMTGGKGFSRTRKYCSRSCAAIVTNGQRTTFINCLHCAKPYPVSQGGSVFCSRHCYYVHDKRFDELGEGARRDRVIREQNGRCKKCGLEEWLGQPLSLQVDHVDGNHSNNARTNLEALCGNCHSITPTWCGRNIKKRYSDHAIIDALASQPNIHSALKLIGMAAKGGNYKRANRLMKKVGRVGIEPTTS